MVQDEAREKEEGEDDDTLGRLSRKKAKEKQGKSEGDKLVQQFRRELGEEMGAEVPPDPDLVPEAGELDHVDPGLRKRRRQRLSFWAEVLPMEDDAEEEGSRLQEARSRSRSSRNPKARRKREAEALVWDEEHGMLSQSQMAEDAGLRDEMKEAVRWTVEDENRTPDEEAGRIWSRIEEEER